MSQFVFKTVRIKPENKAVAMGRIVRCRLSGRESFFYRSKLNFQAYVRVEGIDRLLILPFSQNVGVMRPWQLAWLAERVRSNREVLVLPFMTGDEIMVEYNQKKPKKCNWVDRINDLMREE